MLTSLYCPMCGAEVRDIKKGTPFECAGCRTQMTLVEMPTFYVLEIGKEDE